MPQGWRPTHPGDPPPRWGLSKAGRLVIAITVVVGVVIALVIVLGRPAGASDDVASPTMSQEPSPVPAPRFGVRVEMPEHGFAVTVPEGWLALDPAEDLEDQAWITVTEFDPLATADDVRVLTEVLARARSEGTQLALVEGSTAASCSFTVKAKRAIETAEFADMLASAMSSDDRYAEVERPQSIDLPAGPGFVIVGAYTTPTSPVGSVPVISYLVDGEESILIASCVGAERPADDWLPVFRAFEFLPAEEQPRALDPLNWHSRNRHE